VALGKKSMSENTNDEVGRRSFLATMAGAAGAARFSPQLLAALPVAGVAAAANAAEAEHAGHGGGQTVTAADYAVNFRLEDAPAEVRQRMKDCIADTVAVILYGGQLPWSQMVIAHARATGPNGRCSILGTGETRVHPPSAALAHGSMAHAFELDNLTEPNAGVHSGGTMFSAGLAIAQDRGLSGRALLEAMIAGGEVMIRIGLAGLGSTEPRGFHSPGVTGPFGAAIACGKLMNFDAQKMTYAMGVAGSLCSGLLEFAHSGTGAMVKRLHVGRAAEGGVLAASLADQGFDGPPTILEGEAGYLNAFAAESDPSILTDGLGSDYKTLSILIKHYATHITAHRPIEGLLALRNEHGFGPDDVESIILTGNTRMATTNNIPAPTDRMLAQYSVPFCTALALYRNPIDPESFDEGVESNPEILAMARRISVSEVPGQTRENLNSTVTVNLKDGRSLSRESTDFMGTPTSPLTREGIKEKFMLMAKRFDATAMERMFDRIQNIENEPNLDWLSA
jgi:2-methylcitrate dehydratase PrpD